MSKRNLIVLAVVAGVAVGLAAWLHEDRNAVETASADGIFQPELRERVNEVARLRIERGDASFEVVRGADDGASAWTVPSFGGYPVREERVLELVRRWALLEKQESLTSNPARFASLGLQDPSEPDAESTRLVALDEEGEQIAAAIVGNSKWGGQPAVYVRADGSEQTWRCAGQLRPPRRASEWMDTQVASVAAADVEAAELRAPALAQPLRVVPDEGVGNWKLESVPEGMQAADPGLLRSLATSLSWTNFESVQAVDAVELPAAPSFEVSYWTSSAQRIDVTGWEVDSALWCRFEAELLPEPEAADEADEADEAEAADETATREEAASAVEEWNSRWAGWLYQLPASKTRPWTSAQAEYLEPIPAEEDAGEDTPDDDGAADAAGEAGGGGR